MAIGLVKNVPPLHNAPVQGAGPPSSFPDALNPTSSTQLPESSGIPVSPFSPDQTPTMDPETMWKNANITDPASYGPNYKDPNLIPQTGPDRSGTVPVATGDTRTWIQKYWWMLLIGAVLLGVLFMGNKNSLEYEGDYDSAKPYKPSKKA